jgi:hypothetical protein
MVITGPARVARMRLRAPTLSCFDACAGDIPVSRGVGASVAGRFGTCVARPGERYGEFAGGNYGKHRPECVGDLVRRPRFQAIRLLLRGDHDRHGIVATRPQFRNHGSILPRHDNDVFHAAKDGRHSQLWPLRMVGSFEL